MTVGELIDTLRDLPRDFEVTATGYVNAIMPGYANNIKIDGIADIGWSEHTVSLDLGEISC